MESIFNPIFSSKLLLCIYFFSGVILFVGISFINPFKSKRFNIFYRNICLLSTLLVVVPLIFGHYGYVLEVKQLAVSGDKFCFVDYAISSTPRTHIPVNVFQLNIGSIANGKKLYRTYIGENGRILSFTGDKILYEENSVCHLFDAKDMKVIRDYTPEYLAKNYNEFSSGVQNISVEFDMACGKATYYLDVLAKDGKKHCFDPVNGCRYTMINDTSVFQHYRKDDNEIRKYKNAGDNDGETFIKFSQKTMFSILQHLIIENESCGTEFIDPDFMEVFPELKMVIIRSFATTDETNFLLSAVDFHGKLLWQHSQEDLKCSDYYTKKPEMDVALKNKNNLLFNVGGFFCYMDVVNNTILWKSRF